MSLESVRALVKQDLAATDHFIINQLESKIPFIHEVIEYVLTCGGKRIRPLVLLLSANLFKANSHKHIHIAAVIELIHTATLLHDDVVDSSTLRRGHKTANSIWGNNSSVLVGDFLYSRAFEIMVELRHERILDIFAKATHYIAEGEILQLVNCNNPDTTEDFYFDIIKRKTAKLFEIAAQFAGIIYSDNENVIHALSEYGLHLGLAYQLIDDALDYSQTAELTGKNVGQDIADGKTTLPLIYAMQKSKGKELSLLRDAIETGSNQNLDKVLRVIESTDAIQYTAGAAKRHAEYARAALSVINGSPYRQALEDLSQFVVARNY